MTLVITESLARTVLPLSTNAFYGQLVSLNAAFLRVWRLTRRNMLFDHLSFASLAGYSQSLNRYAFFPINQFRLAGIPEPHSLASEVLSTFHMLPEQTFAFVVQYRSWTCIDSLRGNCITIMQIANLPRCAAPVAPYLVRYRIQHTSCLLPCGLLNHTSRLRSSLHRWYCYLAFPCEVRLNNYLLTFNIHQFSCTSWGR